MTEMIPSREGRTASAECAVFRLRTVGGKLDAQTASQRKDPSKPKTGRRMLRGARATVKIALRQSTRLLEKNDYSDNLFLLTWSPHA